MTFNTTIIELTNELLLVPRIKIKLMIITIKAAGRLMIPPSQGQEVKSEGRYIPISSSSFTKYLLQLILTVADATAYSRTRSQPMIQAINYPIVAYE